MHPCIRWITVGLVLQLAGVPASAVNPASLSRVPSKVFNIADVDNPPVPVKRTAPAYPTELRVARVHGGVAVEFVIGLKGEVVGAQVISTADSRLNDAAVEAVKTWKYKPAKYRGHEVFCRTTTVVEFNLN